MPRRSRAPHKVEPDVSAYSTLKSSPLHDGRHTGPVRQSLPVRAADRTADSAARKTCVFVQDEGRTGERAWQRRIGKG